MKILLVNPKPSGLLTISYESLPPLGLAFLASTLEQKGYEVKIFDNYLYQQPTSQLVKTVLHYNPDVLGISVTSSTVEETKLLTSHIKREMNIPTIVGGAYPTIYPFKALEILGADIAVIGEGETTISNLISSLKKKEALSNVNGIAYKEHNIMKLTKPQRLIKDLDTLPQPAWHLLPIKKYARKPVPPRHLHVWPVDSHNTSRGCPFNCRFCSLSSVWKRNFRYFSPGRVVEDLKFLHDTYGTKGIFFREDNFVVNSERVKEFCRLMRKEKLDVQWMCEARVDLVNQELLVQMKKSGCGYIYFGVESGSNRVLKELLNKEITVQQSLATFKTCRKIGLDVGGSFMMGVPGETFAEMESTLQFMAYLFYNMDVDIMLNRFIGIPTNPIYEEIIAYNWHRHMELGGICEVVTPTFNPEILKVFYAKTWNKLKRQYILCRVKKKQKKLLNWVRKQ